MPRYWVLTDHTRRQIVLVFRGTMSLNELAVDLTCDPAEFEPASSDEPDPTFPQPRPSSPYQPTTSTSLHAHFQQTGKKAQNRPPAEGPAVEVQARDFEYEFGAPSDNETSMPGGLSSPSIPTAPRPRTKSSRSTRKPPARASTVPFPDKSDDHDLEGSRPERMRSASFASVGSFQESYEVHGGMLTMARIMGAKGAPVHEAVRAAMKSCKGYGSCTVLLRISPRACTECGDAELVMCGHSLGSGVAALLGMVGIT